MGDKTIIITQDRDQLVELTRMLENRCPGLNCETARNSQLWNLVFERVDELLQLEVEVGRMKWDRRKISKIEREIGTFGE